jgi:hypothetical protein
LSVTVVPVLHVPDEPLARAEAWTDEVVGEGRDLGAVLRGADGLVPWLWSRWRSLASVGMNEAGLERVVLDYRREIWLWLAGERTWAQCCSGLIGRINRRLVTSDHPGG